MTVKEKSKKVVLQANQRTTHGKGPARLLRRGGIVPGVVYGEGEKPTAVEVSAKELHKVLHTKAGENVLITLRLPKEGSHQETAVLLKEVQHHPLTRAVTHVDFYHISLTKKITIAVPLVFKGEAMGVRNEGGVVEHIRWDLEVECLPTEIPAEISIDISGLALNQSIHVKQITIPAGVVVKTDPEQPVVSCALPKAEEVAPAVEEAAPVEPEVLKQKKPEEIEAQEEAKEKKQEEKKQEQQTKKEEKKS